MDYFYGPVPSRRLGYSLGVDFFPEKTCSFNCIYCQLSSFAKTKIRRAWYINFSRFRRELKEALAGRPKIDYITFSGSGEPALQKGLDKIIKAVKKISRYKYPVCVITNSSLLYRRKVRDELKNADLIIPSLDAPTPEKFRMINRPNINLSLDKIIEGLVKLRREFKGEIWLEIMLVKGINDSGADAKKFRAIIKKINLDKVQLNLPVRPPAESVSVPERNKIKKAKKIIAADTEIVASFSGRRNRPAAAEIKKRITAYLRRRPAQMQDLCRCLGINRSELIKYISQLLEEKKIKTKTKDRIKYFLNND